MKLRKPNTPATAHPMAMNTPKTVAAACPIVWVSVWLAVPSPATGPLPALPAVAAAAVDAPAPAVLLAVVFEPGAVPGVLLVNSSADAAAVVTVVVVVVMVVVVVLVMVVLVMGWHACPPVSPCSCRRVSAQVGSCVCCKPGSPSAVVAAGTVVWVRKGA